MSTALLLHSFGGPEGPDDVMPFLENVTRGRGIPRERLLSVAEHYLHFGGVSPINAQNRALKAALEAELSRRGIPLTVYWGNRNWGPYLTDAVRTMAQDGVSVAHVLATSAYSSYSSCRQYHEDLARTRTALLAEGLAGDRIPVTRKLRHFYDHPGFVTAFADGVRAAYAQLPAEVRDQARVAFTAHSIPTAMNDRSGPQADGAYARQLREACRLVVEEVAGEHDGRPGWEIPAWDLVWQSRSGPPTQPWLEPDISDHLDDLVADGIPAVVVCPIGFVSDHLEVVWDLDNEAAEHAASLGLAFARAATPGTHPAFVSGLVDLVEEQLAGTPPRCLGTLGITGAGCAPDCCPAR